MVIDLLKGYTVLGVISGASKSELSGTSGKSWLSQENFPFVPSSCLEPGWDCKTAGSHLRLASLRMEPCTWGWQSKKTGGMTRVLGIWWSCHVSPDFLNNLINFLFKPLLFQFLLHAADSNLSWYAHPLYYHTRFICLTHNKPNPEMPRFAAEKEFIHRQPSMETREQVLIPLSWRWMAQDICGIKRQGGLRCGERWPKIRKR